MSVDEICIQEYDNNPKTLRLLIQKCQKINFTKYLIYTMIYITKYFIIK